MTTRREFLRSSLAAAGGAAAMTAFWTDLAQGAIDPGRGPYGDLLPADANGIQLPVGFSSRLIATTGQPVANTGHTWHAAPDGGACFSRPDGGWVYVSNSEVVGIGGVGAIRFSANGSIVSAYSILSGSDRNCSGGVTPWGTWLSCEEMATGEVFETDPSGVSPAVRRPALGLFGHEAACVDPATGIVYMSEDDPSGRLYRFVPTVPGNLSAGVLQAAILADSGQLTWIEVPVTGPARDGRTTAFNRGEGMCLGNGVIYFATTADHRVWELNLATQVLVPFYDGNIASSPPLRSPEGLVVHQRTGDLYATEDGGNLEICVIGVVNGLRQVAPFARLVGHATSECTGAAFSPDGSRLYFSSQRGVNGAGIGLTYEITGPFRGAPDGGGGGGAVTPLVLGASHDAHIRAGTNAGINYGATTPIEVCTSANPNDTRWGFIKFDTPGNGVAYTSAKLRIQARLPYPGSAVIEVCGIADATWNQTTLTWNTRPQTTERLLGSFTVLSTAHTTFELDLSEFVRSRRQVGANRMALLFRQPNVGPVAYVRSKEASAGRPELRLS